MIRFKYLAALFLVALIVGCSGAARVPTEPEAAPESQPEAAETGTADQPVPVAATGTPQADPPEATPPATGGSTPPPQNATETVVSLSAVSSVREGGSFRVVVAFAGSSPVQGGCDLTVVDSHGDNWTVRIDANFDSSTIPVAHDNADDAGRTVTVTINSCDLPDLEGAGITVLIGQPKSISVEVITAGPVEPDPNTYEFNLTGVAWDTELTYGSQGEEYMTADIIGTISNALPWDGLLQYEYTDSYSGTTEWLGTHLYEGESVIDGGIGFSPSPPGTVRTLTITLTRFDFTQKIVDGHYYAPSATFEIGSQRTATATITTPDFVRPPDPVYTVSMTPFGGGEAGAPVAEGDKIMFNIAVENIQGIYFTLKFRDNWRTKDDIDQNAMWMNPENGGPVQSRERTTMVCCDGDGWLPEAERPEVRTYTAMLWQSTNLRASTTVRLGRTAGNAAF